MESCKKVAYVKSLVSTHTAVPVEQMALTIGVNLLSDQQSVGEVAGHNSDKLDLSMARLPTGRRPDQYAAPPDGIDLAHAALTSEQELDEASTDLQTKLRGVNAHWNTAVTVAFAPPGVYTAAQLDEKVTAMGITIAGAGNAQHGMPMTPPYATVGGDAAQPARHLIFKILPAEEKITVQLNTRKKTIAVKARRCALEHHAELLLTFFGKAIAITASGARAKAAGLAPPGNTIRELLTRPR